MTAIEGSPIFTVDGPEKPESKKAESEKKSEKKKKRTGEVGRRALESESKPERRPDEAKSEKSVGPFARLKRLEAEAEPVSKPEALEGKLDKGEKAQAVSLIAEQALENLPERPSGAEDLAARDFLERVQAEQDIESAAAATLTELGVSNEEIAAIAAETKPDTEVEAGTEETEPEPEGPETDEEVVFDRSADAEPDADLEDDKATATGLGTAGTPPHVMPPPAPPRGPGGGSPGGPGDSGLPPRGPGPLPPFGAPFGPGVPGGPGGFNTYVAPAAATAPNTASAAEHYYDRGNPAAAALVGGIIGYFIGRRRGRIRTEKKLLPVQKKLEKQVNDLQWELKAKESKIRRVAAEKVRLHGPVVVEKFTNSVAERRMTESKTGSLEQRKRAPEAHQLHGQKSPERIGQVLIAAAEAISTATRQEKAKAPVAAAEQVAPRLTEKRVETLNRAELMDLSEKIIVDGSSLRQIYETHLISEKGLRRLVGEHLRGGDLKKALRQEVVEHEIDFERDPIMRDMAPQQLTSSNGGKAGSAALDTLLQKASLGADTSQEVAFFKAQAHHEALRRQQHLKQQRLVDIGLIGAIALLVGLLVFFFITRG